MKWNSATTISSAIASSCLGNGGCSYIHRACILQSRPADAFAARLLLQDFACAPRMSRTSPCLQHYTTREGPVRSPAQRVAHGGFPNLAIDVLRHLARPHRLLGRGLSAGGPLPAPRAIAQPLYYLILIPAWDVWVLTTNCVYCWGASGIKWNFICSANSGQ